MARLCLPAELIRIGGDPKLVPNVLRRPERGPPVTRRKREIAQTLFVTIKRVEMHLSHAYRKLEISSCGPLDPALLTPAPSPASSSA
jgi:hypothetical protein